MLCIVNYCSASRPTYRGSLVKLNARLVTQVMKSRVIFYLGQGKNKIAKRGILEILFPQSVVLKIKLMVESVQTLSVSASANHRYKVCTKCGTSHSDDVLISHDSLQEVIFKDTWRQWRAQTF